MEEQACAALRPYKGLCCEYTVIHKHLSMMNPQANLNSIQTRLFEVVFILQLTTRNRHFHGW